jgi:hypothetical protein
MNSEQGCIALYTRNSGTMHYFGPYQPIRFPQLNLVPLYTNQIQSKGSGTRFYSNCSNELVFLLQTHVVDALRMATGRNNVQVQHMSRFRAWWGTHGWERKPAPTPPFCGSGADTPCGCQNAPTPPPMGAKADGALHPPPDLASLLVYELDHEASYGGGFAAWRCWLRSANR